MRDLNIGILKNSRFTLKDKMHYQNARISWDTTVKHYVRNGLYNNLPETIKSKIPKTNKHRWESKSEDKYIGCEIAAFVKDELELIKRVGESKNSKKVMEAYFKLVDIYHDILIDVKGIKLEIAN